jgi:hypothetical protein
MASAAIWVMSFLIISKGMGAPPFSIFYGIFLCASTGFPYEYALFIYAAMA